MHMQHPCTHTVFQFLGAGPTGQHCRLVATWLSCRRRKCFGSGHGRAQKESKKRAEERELPRGVKKKKREITATSST